MSKHRYLKPYEILQEGDEREYRVGLAGWGWEPVDPRWFGTRKGDTYPYETRVRRKKE